MNYLFIFILQFSLPFRYATISSFRTPSCSRSNANERNKRFFDFRLWDQATPVHPLQAASLARFREIFHFVQFCSLWYLIVCRHLRQLSPADEEKAWISALSDFLCFKPKIIIFLVQLKSQNNCGDPVILLLKKKCETPSIEKVNERRTQQFKSINAIIITILIQFEWEKIYRFCFLHSIFWP